MSEVKVNKISPRSGTTVTLGDSGDTIAVASGASLSGFTSTGIDDNATSTAITIDSSENVLVGKTSTDLGTAGTALLSSGVSFFTRDGDKVLRVNRLSSDGDIIDLLKDGTTVGSIRAEDGDIVVGNDTRGLKYRDTDFIPRNMDDSTADNVVTLGSTSSRFANLYLGGNIYLGGTGSANALDDYEEGTYTVSAYDSYTGGNQSSTTATGYYTKIGRICHVFFTLNDIDSTGMTAGNEIFFNLPFTIGVTSQGGDIPNIRSLNATITADIIGTSLVSGNSRFNLLKYDYDGNLSGTIVSDINSGFSDLTRVNITYMTA